jgi:hypothetical protein
MTTTTNRGEDVGHPDGDARRSVLPLPACPGHDADDRERWAEQDDGGEEAGDHGEHGEAADLCHAPGNASTIRSTTVVRLWVGPYVPPFTNVTRE